MNTQENKFASYLNDLFEFLRIKSISTLPEHKDDIRRTIDWLKSYLVDAGFPASHIEELYANGMNFENSNPIVFAQRVDNPKNPTFLIYGHYDVQPADPLDEWHSDPFEPTVRDGNIYARGATDDKGQIFTHLAALHHLNGSLWNKSWPVNIKVLIEGEEEIGGKNIDALIKDEQYKELLKADYCLVSDTSFLGPNKPAIEYGLRGMAYMQIDVRMGERDLHSGIFGGAVPNPALALVHILSQLKDQKTGKVLVPGFYDDVVPVSDDERQRLAQLPFSPEEFAGEAGGIRKATPEEGYTVTESTCARPALDINGIWGGFMGAGAKTIIPATAHAKVSVRTVANQDPHTIAQGIQEYVYTIAPKEVSVEVTILHTGDGALVDVNSKGVQYAVTALEETFGAKVYFSRSGGSIPVVALLQKHLGLEPVLIGYGMPDDNLHSPNEKFSLEQFYKGMQCNISLYTRIAKDK